VTSKFGDPMPMLNRVVGRHSPAIPAESRRLFMTVWQLLEHPSLEDTLAFKHRMEGRTDAIIIVLTHITDSVRY
jgi:hypothetical protein